MSSGVLARFALQCVIVAVALFLPAGTLLWPAAWIFLIMLYVFSFAAVRMMLRQNPKLLEERARVTQERQQGWDKLFTFASLIIGAAWIIMMPLDAVRFQWSQMPLWLQAVGAAGVVMALVILYLTFRENAYLSSAVRIQDDRGQQVVSTGLYTLVRHPMYAGLLLLFPSAGFLLGSWLGVLLGLVWGLMFAVRSIGEEKVLREELDGYDEYVVKVKYRLVPHVW